MLELYGNIKRFRKELKMSQEDLADYHEHDRKDELMIRYYQAELPARVKAFTTYKDGDYSIVVNAILSRKQQLAEIEHELKHINNGDHDAELHADLIEVNIRQNPPDQGGSSSFPV